MKENANFTQQKGRRIQVQLQEQVDKKFEKLLKDGHIQKVQADVFIQLTVITVKKQTREKSTECACFI